MMQVTLRTIESAPEQVKSELQAAEAKFGMIPNLYRGMANSPAMLKIYLTFNETLAEFATLSPVEQHVAYLTASAENGCTYCVGAHSILGTMANMPETILTELRAQKVLSDPRLNAIREFTLILMEKRGWVSDEDIKAFTDAGFEQNQVLEIIVILAQKTMSNYFNHIAATPLDEKFQSMAWEAPSN